MIILSGGPIGEHNYAGIGFLIAPTARRFVITFNKYLDRIASLKIRVRGGQVYLVSYYSPHGGYEYVLRRSFFDNLRFTNRR